MDRARGEGELWRRRSVEVGGVCVVMVVVVVGRLMTAVGRKWTRSTMQLDALRLLNPTKDGRVRSDHANISTASYCDDTVMKKPLDPSHKSCIGNDTTQILGTHQNESRKRTEQCKGNKPRYIATR